MSCSFIFEIIAFYVHFYTPFLPCYTKTPGYHNTALTALHHCFHKLARSAMATTTHPFPLPTAYQGDAGTGYDGSDDIGNGGDSSKNSMNISTGGLVAIVVIVVIVAIIGGM